MNDFSNFISYFETKQYLEVKLHATQDEVAQWVSIGAKEGGLDAYTINESENPTRFTFDPSKFINDDDYIKPLKKLYFLPGDIEQFQPATRYITRSALIKRWVDRYEDETDYEYYDDEDKPEDESISFFEARMIDSCLSEYHPITGDVKSTGQLFRCGLFDINDVQKIEAIHDHKNSADYRIALRYLQQKKESDNKVLGECDEDDYIEMEEYEPELELERIRVLEERYKSVVFGEVKFSPVPYDEFMGFSETRKYETYSAYYGNLSSLIKAKKTPTPSYGEPELLLDDAISFYPALNLLGDDWVEEELAVHVFYRTIRVFEKSSAGGMLRPVINIQDWLIQYGKCENFDDKLYSIKKALAMFNYSKSELSQFKPRNRYISFQKAIALMPGQGTRDIDAAGMYLINALEVGEIYAFHFFVGHVTPKLSMDGKRWRNGYFAEWQFNRLIARDFDEQEAPRNMDRTESIEGSREKRNIKTVTVSLVFSIFKKLRANEVSFTMLEDGSAKLVIRRKEIKVCPNDFGLKHKSQGWKLLEGAAVASGELTNALKKINKTNDIASENQKIKAAISRLNKKLMQSMGLQSHPIIFNGTYKFNFKCMRDEFTHGLYASKGADAMDYTFDKSFDHNKDGSSYWGESRDEDEYGTD